MSAAKGIFFACNLRWGITEDQVKNLLCCIVNMPAGNGATILSSANDRESNCHDEKNA